jgi:hypothetical protein
MSRVDAIMTAAPPHHHRTHPCLNRDHDGQPSPSPAGHRGTGRLRIAICRALIRTRSQTGTDHQQRPILTGPWQITRGRGRVMGSRRSWLLRGATTPEAAAFADEHAVTERVRAGRAAQRSAISPSRLGTCVGVVVSRAFHGRAARGGGDCFTAQAAPRRSEACPGRGTCPLCH